MFAWLLTLQIALAAPQQPTEVWVHVPDAHRRAQLSRLPLGFAEGEDAGWLRMHADSEGLDALRASTLRWRLGRQDLLPGDYLGPGEMREALQELAAAHPGRARVVSIGRSLSGRPVLALRISSTHAPLLNWRILGAHHGDETSSAELALDAAQMLLEAEDASVSELLERDAVWVVPHVNPDGVAAFTRYNENGIDLNRNYGYQWSPEEFRAGDAPFSEPETRNIRSLAAWVPFAAGLSGHAGTTNIGWVWNYTTERTPEDNLLEDMADTYAESCTQDGFYITNGADWYITHGDTTDWSYGRYGTLDYTLEVSVEKSPGDAEMARVLDAHREAVRAFLTWPWVVGAWVVDRDTGQGIQSRVQFSDGPPTITGPDGRFGRPIAGDEVEVEIAAPGYQPQTVLLSPHESPPLVRLVPNRLIAIQPVPALLPANRETVFDIGMDAHEVQLVRPGHPPVMASRLGEGWSVDTTGMNPGPWTLMADDFFAPRTIFVGEIDTLVRVESVTTDDTEMVILGGGFGPGTEVWAMWGTARALVRLPIRSGLGSALVVDSTGLPDEPIDMILISQGRQLSLLRSVPPGPGDTGDPFEEDEPPIETEDPPLADSPSDFAGSDAHLKASGCSTVHGYPGFPLLVSLLGLLFRRRMSCAMP